MNKSNDLINQSSDKNFIKYLRRVLPAGYGGVRLPSGGSTGQVLKKASNLDNDVVWADDEGEDTLYVNTYADLPDPTTVPDKVYGVLNSTGIPYISVIFGGNYRAKGFYRSNGIAWNYLGEFPIQATQSEVNAGTVTDKFVSPATLRNIVSQTYIRADRPASGRYIGDEYYQTDNLKGFYKWDGTQWNPPSRYPENASYKRVVTFFSDFTNASPYDSFWTNNNSNGSHSVSTQPVGEVSTGILSVGTASSNIGRNHTFNGVLFIRASAGVIYRAKYRCAMGTVISAPNGTDTCQALIGFFNTGNIRPGYCACFFFDGDITTNTFVAKTRNNGTEIDTVLTLPDGGTYRDYEVIIDGDSSVTYLIDGVEVAKHTTELPSGSGMGTGFGVRKTGGGTASRTMHCDWAAFQMELT